MEFIGEIWWSRRVQAAVTVVRNLGIHIDSDMLMRSHVTKTVSACFSVLRQLRSIGRSVPRTVPSGTHAVFGTVANGLL